MPAKPPMTRRFAWLMIKPGASVINSITSHQQIIHIPVLTRGTIVIDVNRKIHKNFQVDYFWDFPLLTTANQFSALKDDPNVVEVTKESSQEVKELAQNICVSSAVDDDVATQFLESLREYHREQFLNKMGKQCS